MKTLWDASMQVEAGDSDSTGLVQTFDDLFRRWLTLRWDPERIDLTDDAQRWLTLDGGQSQVLRRTSLHFLVGEQLVTDLLGALVYSLVPREDERLYLATQIADEAAHAWFFRRVCSKLLGFTGTIDELLPDMNEPFRQIFGVLAADVARVSHDRKDRDAWVQSITTYHLVVEGFLGLGAQRALMQLFKQVGGFPGFTAGMKGIMQDESRHILFGVLALARRLSEQPELAEKIKERLFSLARPVMLITTGGSLSRFRDSGTPSGVAQLSKRLSFIGLKPADVHDVVDYYRSLAAS